MPPTTFHTLVLFHAISIFPSCYKLTIYSSSSGCYLQQPVSKGGEKISQSTPLPQQTAALLYKNLATPPLLFTKTGITVFPYFTVGL